jgi:hypothetical protein
MKNQLKTIFQAINDCMNVQDIIITERNVAFTFKGYLASHDIEKLVKTLEIDHYLVKKHNYEKMEIVFTYNSVFQD